jgi:hypothetical protein
MRNIILLSILSIVMTGCKSHHQNKGRNIVSRTNENVSLVAALPHAVIYKTTNDYSQNVPILLSADKTQILSYPHPSDLFYNEKLALPSPLNKGYLLDNRGIDKNVAFLKYTYEEYSKFENVPALDELFRNIIDKDPLTELWDCGENANYSDLQKTLNDWIDADMLSGKCKRIR